MARAKGSSPANRPSTTGSKPPPPVVLPLVTMRAHKLTPARLAVAAGFYLVFALGLIPILA